MRMIFAIPLLFVTGCGVNHDEGNDQVTMEYNEQQAEQAASDVGNAAEQAGEAIVNGAEDAAAAVRNTDVDVNVNTQGGEASPEAQ